MNRRDFFGASFVAAAVTHSTLGKPQGKEALLWTPATDNIIKVPASATDEDIHQMIYGGANMITLVMRDGTQINIPFTKLHEARVHWSPSMAEVQILTEIPRTQRISSAFSPVVRHVVMQDQEMEFKVTPRHNEIVTR